MIVYAIELRTPQAIAVAGMLFGERTPVTDESGAFRLVRVRDDGDERLALGPLVLHRTDKTHIEPEPPKHQWAVLLEICKTVALLSVIAANWKATCAQPLYGALRAKGFTHEKAEKAVRDIAVLAEQPVEVMTKQCPEDVGPLLDAGVPKDWIESREPDADLTELNEQYSYVIDEGVVLRVYDGRRVPMDVTAFKNALRNRTHDELVKNKDGNPVLKQTPLADWWMANPLRRTYDRCEFLPGLKAPPRGVFNTWPGFGVDPRPGDCSKFKALVRDIITSGNIDHFRYLWRWMANAVQNPGTPGQVTIVLHGGQGTGKGSFAKYFGRLFGACYMPIGNAARITGQFTGHLHNKIVVFVDEAVFVDDQKAKSVLKFFSTEESIDGRAMFKEAAEVRNCLHLILGSNEEHVLDVSADDRRYFVLRVSGEQAKNVAYFGAIAEEMRSGGPEALLHELLAEDLSEFDVRSRPETRALAAQKEASLSPMDAWMLDLLKSGVLPATTWPKHPRRAERGMLLDSMRRSAGTLLNGKKDADLARYLKTWGAVEKKGPGSNPLYILMPELGELRAAWAKRLPSPKWDLLAMWGEVAESPADDEDDEDGGGGGGPF